MKEETFDKIKELIQSINAYMPSVNIGSEKQMRIYNAIHELKNHSEKEAKKKIPFR